MQVKMYYILDEDLAKLYPYVNDVIKALSAGMQRVEQQVTVGEDLPVFKITGYWVGDIIRLDIKPAGGKLC